MANCHGVYIVGAIGPFLVVNLSLPWEEVTRPDSGCYIKGNFNIANILKPRLSHHMPWLNLTTINLSRANQWANF